MQRKLRVVVNLFLIGLVVALAPSTLRAQSTQQPLVNAPEIQETLNQGLACESESRWQDAIQVYEGAIKKHLDSKDIVRRLDICRIHHDVVRRYSDSSFTSALDRMSANTSLDLYSEVLSKLELNFVEPLQLNDLLRHGTAYLEVALTEEDFLKKHLQNIPREQVEHFRANVHTMVLGRTVRSRSEARGLVATVANHANKQLGLSPTATIHEYIAGAVGLLDPYSGYMTAGELAEVMAQIKGNLIGLGVELFAEKDELKIEEVFSGSPAEMAGLMSGDMILQVDDSVTASITAKKAADLLRGPENSQVRLLIARDSFPPRNVLVTRKRVEVPSVATSEMIDEEGRIGYIRITNFQETTAAEVDQSLWKLHRLGMKSLIIDLRRNPGGLLDAAVEVADRFLRQGTIVTTRGRNGNENRNYLAKEPQTWDVPLVVLIDKDSASASEIFAGAIRDHRRGTLVGQTSYGKGSVQGLFHTDTAAGGLRLTVSKFFSPLGQPISLRGVQPDIAIAPVQDTGDASVVALKPNTNKAPPKYVNFRNRKQDLALQRAIEAARDSVKLTQRP